MDFQKFCEYSNLEVKSYQEEGVAWCSGREEGDRYGKGGIIADEMGLGKTIMMIGTIMKNFKRRTLIVMPVVLIEQWRNQFIKTTGHNPVVYHGKNTKVLTSEDLERFPIVLTSYGTLLSDNKRQGKLFNIKWDRVICDEAHHLRNKKTKIAHITNELQRDITWMVTGTPIQNHTNDLFTLFDVLNISNKLYTEIETLRDILKKVILRRTKNQVGIEMPGVTVTRVSCNWECDEQQLSEEIHETLSFSGLKLKPLEKGVHLEMMLYARMMCIYPEMATKNIKKMNARGILSENNLVGLNCKGKMSKLLETLKERKDNGNKKIIFTTFRMETDYVKEELSKEGLRVDVIDGRVTKNMRNEILNKDLDVLLLQIKTGNEGLNLQQYNEVYFITPDWNPKMQEQAIARCHRMGQEKEVHVMKFVMDSFDSEGKTKSIEMHTEDIHEVKNEMAIKIYE